MFWLQMACLKLLHWCVEVIMHLCAFDIFQKVVFCLTLYTVEVNLQIFVMI